MGGAEGDEKGVTSGNRVFVLAKKRKQDDPDASGRELKRSMQQLPGDELMTVNKPEDSTIAVQLAALRAARDTFQAEAKGTGRQLAAIQLELQKRDTELKEAKSNAVAKCSHAYGSRKAKILQLETENAALKIKNAKLIGENKNLKEDTKDKYWHGFIANNTVKFEYPKYVVKGPGKQQK